MPFHDLECVVCIDVYNVAGNNTSLCCRLSSRHPLISLWIPRLKALMLLRSHLWLLQFPVWVSYSSVFAASGQLLLSGRHNWKWLS